MQYLFYLFPKISAHFILYSGNDTISGNNRYKKRLPVISVAAVCEEARTADFYIIESCSPESSALSVAPAAGRFFVLYLCGFANSPFT